MQSFVYPATLTPEKEEGGFVVKFKFFLDDLYSPTFICNLVMISHLKIRKRTQRQNVPIQGLTAFLLVLKADTRPLFLYPFRPLAICS